MTFHELLHLIKNVINTKKFGLKLELSRNASKPWKIACLRDGNYAGGSVGRRSVSLKISC